MSELAKRTDVSKSMISQIERGDVLPSLSTLEKIAIALDLSIASFFQQNIEDSTEVDFVVSGDKRSKMMIPDSSTVYHVLTPTLHESLEFLLVEFPPSSDETGRDTFKHQGEEYFYVLDGEMKLTVGTKTRMIKTGDSGCFNSNNKHLYENCKDTPAKVLIVATKP
jgi:transcriptional regulator with XRE-family HTH domain